MSLDAAKRRILARVSLEQLIGERVKLTSRSGRKMGLCPFHAEKSPSFTIYDDHYFCFGCRAHGDAIDFVRHQHGLSYIEALRHLAEKFQVEVPELDASNQDFRRHKDEARFYRLMQAAQEYFNSNLASERGAAARAYLAGRGFSEENIKDFGFGVAWDEPHALVQRLRQNNFSTSDMVECSLAVSTKHGKIYDFFQHRLMIPILDRYGRVIAFGGRTLGNDPAKYKNSRETTLFDKSATLFGWHRAREAIREKGFAIVVEGYMDALQLWNFGFTQTVACLGTALTLEHLKQLSQITERIYLLFDGDFAGQNASLRTVQHALDVPKTQIKVVALPAREDPDSYLRKEGAAGLNGLIAESTDLLDFAITTEIAGAHDLAIPDLVSQKFVPWLRAIPDRIERAFLVQRLAKLANIPADDIARALGDKAPPRKQPEKAKDVGEPKVARRPLTRLEYELLAHLYFAAPNELDLTALHTVLKEYLEWDELWQQFAEEMIDLLSQNQQPASNPRSNWQAGSHPQLMDILDNFTKNAPAFETRQRNALVARLLQTIRREGIRKSISLLKSKLSIRGWEDSGQDSQEILTAISQLNRELTQLEQALRV